MKNRRRFLEGMNDIDNELLMRAEESEIVNKKSGSRMKWIIIAAVICLVLVISLTVAIFSIREGLKNGSDTNIGSDLEDVLQVPISDVYWSDTREKNTNTVKWNLSETAIVFPWSERESYEKYTSMVMDGEEYNSRSSYYGEGIHSNQIGKKLADAECSGYDMYEDDTHTEKCEVFEIVGVDSQRIVAVKYEDDNAYYAFIKKEHQAPKTLGELIGALNLTENIKLNSFYCDENQDHKDEHYALSNESSDTLWDILKECSGAPICSDEDYRNSYNSATKLSFAITSSTIGVYNLSFAFTEDGYLRTNIEDYGYIYNIGKETVSKITDLAMKNKLVILIPEKQYLVGTITEIGEDYIKVDDSVMMKNPEQGIEFTVYANKRNKLSAFIKVEHFKVGETVRVEHSYLLKDSYTEIKNAVDIHECKITSGGQVLIPE